MWYKDGEPLLAQLAGHRLQGRHELDGANCSHTITAITIPTHFGSVQRLLKEERVKKGGKVMQER